MAERNTKNPIQDSLQALRQTGIDEITRKQWLAIRNTAARQIDPNNAEVMSVYANPLSYTSGVTGRPYREVYFRSPGSDEWVRYQDLPPDTRLAVAKKYPSAWDH